MSKSDSEIQDHLMILDNLVDDQELKDELQSLDDLLDELQEEEAAAAAPVKTPEPRVVWRKRDNTGNIVHARPRSSRNHSDKADHIRKTDPPFIAPDPNCEVAFTPETVECFLQDLQHSLSEFSGDEASPLETPRDPLLASSNWSKRQSLFSERWRAERPRLVNTAAEREHVATHICQQCGSNPAAVRCCDCRPRPFFCAECDVSMHTRHVLHNRDAMTAGFFQPLPPTTYVVDKALSHCVRLVPVEMPDKICGCSPESLRVSPGKTVAVVTMNGRHDLSMPELICEACQATWTSGVADLNRSDYWPATLQFATVYATDVFFSFEEMKMAAPGLSCQAFLRMLNQRTVRFGRTGKISADSFLKSFFEWEAVRFELDNMCKEETFNCPACTPEMLAVSVDGNRKHYRFKNAARSEEQAIFEDVFIAKDEDVKRFVDHIHNTTKHVSGRGVCGGEWSAARETSQRSASKVDEEGLELAVKWSGAYQDGAGLTLGEEVEQCNAFLSRIAVTTKHMSKAGRTDMLTLMAMRWNQQKVNNLAISLTRRYQKTTKSLQSQLQNLETMKAQLTVTASQLEDWVNDVKDWADAATTATTTTNDADALASRIEVLVASIKRRSQRLYKDNDGNKGRARIRRKIREEKGILTSVVEKYNRMVPITETLCLDTILSGETAWPWQLPHSDSVDLRTKRRAFDIIMSVRRLEEEQKILVAEMDHHWKSLSARSDTLRELSCLFSNSQCDLSGEGLKGLHSIILRKRHQIREMKVQARDCYLQVLSGAENISFLDNASSDEYDSDDDISDDGL
ncbi:si:dkey-29d5.2 [Pimephales promelas]|nr:si:dkey-29d5.2 [Pimephales promelas]